MHGGASPVGTATSAPQARQGATLPHPPVDVGEQVERLELLLCLAGGTEDGKALFQPFPVGHCTIDGIDLASVRTRKSVAEASSVMGRSARKSFVMRTSNSSGLFSRMSTLSSKAGSSLNGRRSHPIPTKRSATSRESGKRVCFMAQGLGVSATKETKSHGIGKGQDVKSKSRTLFSATRPATSNS